MPIATPAPNVTSVCEGFLLRPGASITSEVAAEPRLPSYGRLEAGHVYKEARGWASLQVAGRKTLLTKL